MKIPILTVSLIAVFAASVLAEGRGTIQETADRIIVEYSDDPVGSLPESVKETATVEPAKHQDAAPSDKTSIFKERFEKKRVERAARRKQYQEQRQGETE